MSDPQPPKDSDVNDAWQEVGRQFQKLGESLAAAFQTTANDDSTREHLRDLQDGLESAVQGIRSTVQKGVTELEARNFNEQARHAADSLIDAGEQTVEEVRPHLLSVLEKLNVELDRWIDNLNNKPAEPPAGEEKPKE